uniref:TBC1 domain family member 2B n=1 Tax=Parascaris univalens TaxID=6257 RepID=A0A915AWG0_PARUN
KPRKRMFFALEETESVLTFFKDESDFVKKKEPVGIIPLLNAACTVAESSSTAFAIHANGRTYGFDADNEQSAARWMNALQNRRESVDLNENIRRTSRHCKRRSSSLGHSRSASLPSESELRTKRLQRNHMSNRRQHATALNRVHSTVFPPSNGRCLDEKEKYEGRRERAPSWFDEWIRTWLNEQPFNTCGIETDKSSSAHTRDQCDWELRTSSTTTSTCDSEQYSTVSGEVANADEVHYLRIITNRQKERIEQLNEEKKRLTVEISQLKAFQNATAEAINDNFKASLITQNKFLNAEVLRLSERSEAEQRTIKKLKKEKEVLEEDMNSFRREYVFLLQSCIRIPLSDQHSMDVLQVKLLGGDVHKKRVLRLLEEARITDPTLPTFECVTGLGNYVDMYGYRHSFVDEGLALHYICTLLHAHYSRRSQAYAEHRNAWKEYLRKCKYQISNTPEARRLVRGGIPCELRTSVWRALIHQQVADVKKKYGKYYYRNLCNSQGTLAERQYIATQQKQIMLDLLRTMPGNVHFMSPTCKGVQQLEQVLRAYCLHNPVVGYCQGMNFLASTAMLFVGAEDTFWFLVAVTEKYFNASYFDQSLTGAQADQEVLKELLCLRLPRLSAHLDACDIDLATVTLNWFLALFFDAVPFQTMIRIWDCFLLEGPKVLFRFAVALLSIHENEVLTRTDTISVMKVLKASVRLTYDYEGLSKLAFDATQPFPSRSRIEQKQRAYLSILTERLSRRRQLLSCFSNTSSASQNNGLVIELISFCDGEQGSGFICSGNQTKGIISRLTVSDGASSLQRLQLELDCRILSMTIPNGRIAFLSLLSAYIVALHIKDTDLEILWELKLNDVALKLLHNGDRLYAALANGTLTVIEKVTELVPSELELYRLPIGAAPISDVAIVDDTMWLAVACKVVVLSIPSLTTLKRIYVASAASGSGAPLFEKIRCMCASPHGVWIVTAHSTLVQLWRESECRLLFDASYDHSHKFRKPSLSDWDEKEEMEITMVLFVHEQVWIGTNDGYLIIYEVKNSDSNETSKNADAPSKQKYPAGRRLSPKSGSVSDIQQSPTYYIPTESETRHDEKVSVAEYPAAERKARKISLFIDRSTKRYSAVQRGSRDALGEPTHVSATASPSRITQPVQVDACNFASNSDKADQHEVRTRMCVLSGLGMSGDSAVSVFSSDENTDDGPLSTAQNSSALFSTVISERLHESRSRSHGRGLVRSSTAPSGPSLHVLVDPSSLSSNVSMEYDDLFELYSEADGAIPSTSNAFVRKSSLPLTSTLRRNLEPTSTRMSADKNTVPADSGPTVTSPAASISSRHAADAWRTFQESDFKLRRKDLDFEETLGRSVFSETYVKCSNDFALDASNSSTSTQSISSGITLELDMKIKIADKPVKCAQVTRVGNETVVVTCAGNYDDVESVLRWTIDRKGSKDGELWINDPIVDEYLRKKSAAFHDAQCS